MDPPQADTCGKCGVKIDPDPGLIHRQRRKARLRRLLRQRDSTTQQRLTELATLRQRRGFSTFLKIPGPPVRRPLSDRICPSRPPCSIAVTVQPRLNPTPPTNKWTG
jgi:hypothetical protein